MENKPKDLKREILEPLIGRTGYNYSNIKGTEGHSNDLLEIAEKAMEQYADLKLSEWQASNPKPEEKPYSLEYLERCIGAGLSIGYDKAFDIDKKSEMVQSIIKSMPPPPVIPKPEQGMKEAKNKIAVAKGYPSWDEMENFYIDNNSSVVAVQLISSAYNDLISNLYPSHTEAKEGEIVSDGFGNTWSAFCPTCKNKTMQIVRPGKVQCSMCG